MAENTPRKKYRLRKGRVAGASAVLVVIIVLVVLVIMNIVKSCSNNKNNGGTPVDGTVNPEELVNEGEFINISLEDCNLYVGTKMALTCTSNPEDLADQVIWKSSDTSVVTVDARGNILVKAVGAAAVTATCGVLSDSVVINGIERRMDDDNVRSELPIYDVQEGKLVVIQTAAGEDDRQPDETTGETKGEKPSASKEETPSETAAVVPEETTANKVNWKKEIISAIGNTSFRQYSSGIYVLQEDDNYLGEIIVGDKFVQIYVSMRTSGLDSAVKNVISVLLPEEYDNVYSQFSMISKDRTISADGRKITMVAPVNGSHSQLIIYY